MARRLINALATASIFTLALAACNTVQGAGQDVQSVGEAVEEEL